MSKKLRTFLLSIALLSPMSPAGAADYGEEVGMKLGSGFSNIALSWLEVPKNMINTTNQTNLALGLIGGVIKGVLHTLARTTAGVTDVLSAPLPTQPIVEPQFIWQNFDVETHYNPVFKLKN